MNEIFYEISFGHFLVLSSVLFVIGIAGVLLRRNALIVLMSIELMLNAGNMALLTFSRMHGGNLSSLNGVDMGMRGQAFAFLVIAIAAAEAAIGLAIVVQVFRTRAHVSLDQLDLLHN